MADRILQMGGAARFDGKWTEVSDVDPSNAVRSAPAFSDASRSRTQSRSPRRWAIRSLNREPSTEQKQTTQEARKEVLQREGPTKESHETCNQPSFRRAQPTGYDPDSYSAPSTGFPSNTISLVRFSGGMSILMVRR